MENPKPQLLLSPQENVHKVNQQENNKNIEGTKELEIKDPEIKEPEIKKPEIKEPEIKASEVQKSEIKESEKKGI